MLIWCRPPPVSAWKEIHNKKWSNYIHAHYFHFSIKCFCCDWIKIPFVQRSSMIYLHPYMNTLKKKKKKKKSLAAWRIFKISGMRNRFFFFWPNPKSLATCSHAQSWLKPRVSVNPSEVRGVAHHLRGIRGVQLPNKCTVALASVRQRVKNVPQV